MASAAATNGQAIKPKQEYIKQHEELTLVPAKVYGSKSKNHAALKRAVQLSSVDPT